MASWGELEAAEPAFAARAMAIFTATTNAVIATLRADGSPRISGIDLSFHDGQAWIGSMTGARKAADLHRDPRLALHCVPYESRPDAGTAGHIAADAKLDGRAIAITDEATFARHGRHMLDTIGWDPPLPYDLFSIDVTALVVVRGEDDALVIQRWTPDSGLRRLSRTHDTPAE